jgi:hypothetical protein
VKTGKSIGIIPVSDQRCPETYTYNGTVLQCEAYRGHTCVHYNGSIWWGNVEGFPDNPSREPSALVFWLALLSGLGIIALAWLYWLFH